jgi:TolB-like protein/DNA-binding winged helix-turn-helix (wHTH) protein/Tfp pilus assembly protein PilF
METLFSTESSMFEGFRLDRRAGVLFRRDERGVFAPMAIGSRALDILGVLVERPGDLVSRAEIIEAVWPGTAVEDSNLNVQIAALRRVLDEGRADGSCIQTIPGRGYRFAVPVTRVDFSAPPTSGGGNGAGGPVAEPPEPRHLLAPNQPSNTRPAATPRKHEGLWCGGVALLAGALCLLAVAVTTSDWHLPQPAEARRAPRLSIVVLPFTDLGHDPDGQNFVEGITKDLTADLSLRSDIRVISPNTAFFYGKKLVDTKQIGRELSVRYALEGSVQRSGNRLRVNAQLIDTEKDTQLWAERFDRDADDLFALQNEISSRLANTLVWELTAAEAARTTALPDALDFILRARATALKGPEREHKNEAISFFERAVALDPQSVAAQTGLAGVLMARVREGQTDSPAADIERAEGLVKQALALSPRSASVHFIKGDLLRTEGRCHEAIPEYETVLASNQNSMLALFGIGICKVLTGSVGEAIQPFEESIRLDPRHPYIVYRYDWLGLAHLLLSHTDQAIVWFEKARSVSPGISGSHAHLASAYALNGETGRAADELAEARKLAGDDRYSSITKTWVPKARALADATYVAGLRKAGMPEE